MQSEQEAPPRSLGPGEAAGPTRERSRWAFAPFLAVALGILGLGHYYVWARLVRDLPWPEPARLLFSGLLFALAAGVLLSFVLRRARRRGLAAGLQTVLLAWLGVGFLLIVGLLAADLALGLLGLGRSAGLSGLSRVEAREIFTLAGAAAGAAASLAALFGALGPPQLREVEVRLPALPSGARGLTIVQLSDLHIGPTLGRPFLERIVRRVNALEPDLVAITGDLVDGPVERLGEAIEPLRELRARHGVYFVPGNHDHYAGLPGWLRRLGELGVEVLQNRWTLVRAGSAGEAEIVLAGVDDPAARWLGTGGPDLERALSGRPEGRPVVLLAHQPGQFDRAAGLGVALQLSGHTHGGQIFPFHLLVHLFQPYVAGLYRKDRSQLYVSRGTGFWGPPLRLGAPAEITRLVLEAA